jgi:ATP-dependent DNA ligase
MQRRKDVMLCYPFEERRLIDPKFGWNFQHGVFVQPKLDGIRATTRRNEDGQVVLISSEGNILPIPHITDVLEDMKLPFDLDGELYCHGKSFEWISSRVKLGSYEDVKELQYHVFDQWTSEPVAFKFRYKILWNLFSQRPTYKTDSIVQIVPTTELFSTDSALMLDFIIGHLNDYVNRGYEGIILRCPSAIYETKRSRFIMKFKPAKTDCYQIVGIEQAHTMEGKPKGMVGVFIVISPDSSQEFKISAGRFTHEERIKMWKQRPLGKFLEFQYQNKTAKDDFRMAFGLKIKEDFSG